MTNVLSLTRMIQISSIHQIFFLLHSSCHPLYRHLAVTRLQLANCAAVDDRSAQTTKRRRQQVKHIQALRKTLNRNRLSLEQLPLPYYYFFDHWQHDHFDITCCLRTAHSTVITERPARDCFISLTSLAQMGAR
jgi:hypothetical protein